MNRYTVGGGIALLVATLAGGGFLTLRNPGDASPVQGAQPPGAKLQANPVPVAGVSAIDGGAQVNPVGVSPGGTVSTGQVPMCYASKPYCAELPKADAGGMLVVEPGKWYEATIEGDGSGGTVGCWSDNGAITTPNDAGPGACFGFNKLREGQKPIGFLSTTYCQADAGCSTIPVDGGIVCQADVGCVNETHLWFYALTSSGLGVTLCPEIPCR